MSMMKNKIILIVLIVFGVLLITGAYFLIAQENQIISQKVQIASLQETINSDNHWINEDEKTLKDLTGTDNPFYIPPKAPTLTPVVPSADPHAGMKEVKTMNCQPEGSNGSTNCTEYDYWYNPNVTPQQQAINPAMLQQPVQQPLPTMTKF